MINYDTMDDRLVIFGSIFTVSNRLQLLLDKKMPEISAKQWFILTMLSFFKNPPSLIELAKVCDTSYQNVKQIVLRLEEKGFAKLEGDEKDKRTKRVFVTSKYTDWIKETESQSNCFVDKLFETMSEKQIKDFKNLLLLIYDRLEVM